MDDDIIEQANHDMANVEGVNFLKTHDGLTMRLSDNYEDNNLIYR